MNTLLKKTTFVLFCFFVSLTSSASADETQASRFLYCANVAQFFYQYFLKNDPNSQAVNIYRLTRDNFRLAAAASKSFPDPQSFASENDAALKKVIAVLEREKSENIDLMSSESKSCAETMSKDVVPLLKPKNAQGS